MTKYMKLCNLMMNLLKNKYPNLKTKHGYNPSSRLVEISFIECDANYSITRDCKWKDLKRRVDKLFNKEDEYIDCSICCKKMSSRVFCPKCSNWTCGSCYINIIRIGHGVHTCPYCKRSMGSKIDYAGVEIIVQCILEKLNMKLVENT